VIASNPQRRREAAKEKENQQGNIKSMGERNTVTNC